MSTCVEDEVQLGFESHEVRFSFFFFIFGVFRVLNLVFSSISLIAVSALGPPLLLMAFFLHSDVTRNSFFLFHVLVLLTFFMFSYILVFS
jgi:hypothetical protein